MFLKLSQQAAPSSDLSADSECFRLWVNWCSLRSSSAHHSYEHSHWQLPMGDHASWRLHTIPSSTATGSCPWGIIHPGICTPFLRAQPLAAAHGGSYILASAHHYFEHSHWQLPMGDHTSWRLHTIPLSTATGSCPWGIIHPGVCTGLRYMI